MSFQRVQSFVEKGQEESGKNKTPAVKSAVLFASVMGVAVSIFLITYLSIENLATISLANGKNRIMKVSVR